MGTGAGCVERPGMALRRRIGRSVDSRKISRTATVRQCCGAEDQGSELGLTDFRG
jgi:hypothetical protein